MLVLLSPGFILLQPIGALSELVLAIYLKHPPIFLCARF